jgi:hypothetical protein
MLKKTILGVCLFLSINIIYGCAVMVPFFPFMGPAYDGIASWKGREAVKYYLADVDKIHQVVLQSARQMDLETKGSASDSGYGYSLEIKGKDHLQIKILPYEKTITKVSIKVTLFGDKQFATFFYQTIDANLSKEDD